jgi:ketosteroid isomerase-like protein
MGERVSDEDLEALKRAFDRWGRSGDRGIDFDGLDPEVEFHTPLSSTRGEPYRGHAGVREWLSDINDQFDDWHSRADEWVPLEDGRVLVLGELHLRGRESGVEFDQPMAWLFTLREGKLFRNEVFDDHRDALRAAGLE